MPSQNPDVEASKSRLPILLVETYTKCNLTYTAEQGNQVSWLAQTGFAAFGKGVQLISGPSYDEIEQLSRLTLPPHYDNYYDL